MQRRHNFPSTSGRATMDSARARTTAFAGWLLCGLSGALGACSSATTVASDAGAVGLCPPNVADADLSKPTVSFAADIMPIFQQSCALPGGNCHGDPSVVSSFRPLLGSSDGDAGVGTRQSVWNGLVGVKSGEDLAMNLITPGDPAASFLMHKVDGDQSMLISECMVPGSHRPNCGAFMPYQAPAILAVSTRDTIRRWIQQGANND